MCTCIIIIVLETDALGLYSKYLALNALKPVGVSDEIRQKVEGKRSTLVFHPCILFEYFCWDKPHSMIYASVITKSAYLYVCT